MSGHSKWATIHRAKEVKDQARGKVFSKLSRIITIAAKTGGGGNPDTNFKLRDAIERARAVNMPKDSIERAINKANEFGDLFEVIYEGFGPSGVSVIVEAATDNKNRTVSEIKNIFEKAGGTLGSPGSVSYNFESKGLIIVKKESDIDSLTLKLIDLGAGDIEEAGQEFEVYIEPSQTHTVRKKIEGAGISVKSAEIVMRPKAYIEVGNESEERQVFDFLESLEEHDDVQKVFTNIS